MLHESSVEQGTLSLIHDIVALPELAEFHLCGGTALALRFGHRESVDLDFFTNQGIDKAYMDEYMKESFDGYRMVPVKVKTFFFCYINGVKCDFIHQNAEAIQPYENIDGIRFWSLPDIAAMKLNAIYGRGSKKDFWDIDELLNHYSFKELVDFFFEKFPSAFPEGLMMSLVYFADAEEEADPVSFKEKKWAQIKKRIETEVKKEFRS